MAASLLAAIGMPEMVTQRAADYEALAITIGTQPERLAALKQKVAANSLTKLLFDIAQSTRNIEAASTRMTERHTGGLPPDHIFIV